MKWLLLLLLFCCTSCHHTPWHHSSIPSGNPNYDLAKLTYPPTTPHHGIELEIIRHQVELQGYVHVQQYTLPPRGGNPHETTLTIKTNGASKTFVIPLLEGKQRAHLTNSCLDYLLQMLELNPSVTLISGHFSQILDSTNFRHHKDTLLRVPHRLLPENLISFEL